MSRGTVTKSRTEKKGGVSVPTPAIAHEIIPGKYTDQDWNAMLEKEDGEEFIGEILQELMQQTMQKAYDSYINRQLLPFTISQAKDAILQIIEWQFLAHDDGESEVDKDLGWIPDEEPDPATTDCWAQGSVPKFFLPPPPPVIEEEPEEISEEVCPGEGEEAPGVEEEQVSETASVEEPPVVIETEEPEAAPETLPESPKEEVLKKKRSGYKPHCGRLPSAGVSKMTESLEDTEIKLWEQEARQSMSPEKGVDLSLIQMPISCHSLLRMQQGRPPGNKEVVYDEMGNVIAVVKLNPDRLPTHRVKVGYHIVDPTVEAAEARLDAMKKGRLTRKESQMKAAKHKTGKRGSMVSSSVVSGVTHTTLSDSESKTPLPPALIDTVDLAPGVIIREGLQVRKGPRRFVKKSNQLTEETERMLKPISLCTTLPSVDVSEILERRTPVLKPIRETPPIPPINPYPPQQPRVA